MEKEKGLKYDNDKLRWGLLPHDVIEGAVKVLTYGAKKYAPNNWKIIEDAKNRYFAAAMRHLIKFKRGN